MRLNREQVIERLKEGEPLIDGGVQARFKDGDICNIFTYWYLRDTKKILPIYLDPPQPGVTCCWYWDVPEGGDNE